MLKRPECFTNGFHLTSFPLDEKIMHWVREEKWDDLDSHFKKMTREGGELFSFLQKFHDFTSMEFIISIRDSKNEWEEDGIWHDDGTRVFAFSLSLTEPAGTLDGGRLEIRRKNEAQLESIPTPKAGSIILFLTGVHGFEHRTRAVTQGKRIIIAGWCSQ